MVEDRLSMFEKRVLRGVFGPVSDKMPGGWRTLHNEELDNLCSSLNTIRFKDDDTDTVCGMCDADRKCVQNFLWKT